MIASRGILSHCIWKQLGLAACSLSALLSLVVNTAAGQERADRPNFLIILADDLGFSDLGCYGGEINTVNLDALAANGLRYSQFYNTARCWPTRAALMTGYYPQQVNADAFPSSGRHGFHARPVWSRLLPELLAPLGYHSYHTGKWHLHGKPLENGFERSYELNDHDRFFSPTQHRLDGTELPRPGEDESFYVTTTIADYAIEFLQHHEDKHPGKPFLEFVAFTAPHFPLHAQAEDTRRYVEQYDVGWDRIRSARWKRMQATGQFPGAISALEPEIGPPYDFPEALDQLGSAEVNRELAWNELNYEQQVFQSAKMAVHAAMIDRMDRDIGRIVAELKRLQVYEDTVIFFLSDNGASAEIMVRGDGHNPQAVPGSAESYLCLGPGWSSAANTPFRRHKTWVHEGGIATPLIVHWPTRIKEGGAWRKAVGHVIDIAPTIVSLAGGGWPTTIESQQVPSPPGVSLESTFDRDLQPQRQCLWWLHEMNRAIRIGDWKAVAARGEEWELYDLSHDRAETSNLADAFPEKLRELVQTWKQYTASLESTASE